MLFEVTVLLCERFPAYTPTAVRQTPAREIFQLVKRLNEYDARKIKETKKGKVIRRPAGDDWF